MGFYLMRALLNLLFRSFHSSSIDCAEIAFAHYVGILLRGLTLTTILLGLASTLLCYYYHLTADIPLNLIGTTFLFPVSFRHYFSLIEIGVSEMTAAEVLLSQCSIHIWPPRACIARLGRHQIECSLDLHCHKRVGANSVQARTFKKVRGQFTNYANPIKQSLAGLRKF